MPMNFHDDQNRLSYASRDADPSWISFIQKTIDVSDKVIADIGCGGGIYSKALIQMGAAHVVGVDFSDAMLKAATHQCENIQNVAFQKGEAYQTNLPADGFDIVLERALIHHLDDLDACFKEAYRILKKEGIFIVQDRTPQDCLLPGDEHNLRGYFFEMFPHLVEHETSRRYDSDQVQDALESSGFKIMKISKLWETRRIYHSLEQLKSDLLHRTGRSILHELTDTELQELTNFIIEKLINRKLPIVEKDSWTVWFAMKK